MHYGFFLAFRLVSTSFALVLLYNNFNLVEKKVISLKQGKHKKNNTDRVKKLLHKTFKTLKIVFKALEVLKTIIELFQ